MLGQFLALGGIITIIRHAIEEPRKVWNDYVLMNAAGACVIQIQTLKYGLENLSPFEGLPIHADRGSIWPLRSAWSQ